MELKAFSIYDVKAEAFNQPFFMLTEGEAIRGFQAELNNNDSMMRQYPHDYTLYMIGRFDNKDGKLTTELKDLGTAASHRVDQHNVEILFPENKEESA